MEIKDRNTVKKSVFAGKGKNDIIRALLEDGWFKLKGGTDNFFKKRKNFIIEISGLNHPLWNVIIKPLNEQFDEQDWKLLKDLESLNNLGQIKNRKLYIDAKNKNEITHMLREMFRSGSNLIFSENYIILRQGKKVKIFKSAASLDLVAKQDGLYSGTKRIL